MGFLKCGGKHQVKETAPTDGDALWRARLAPGFPVDVNKTGKWMDGVIVAEGTAGFQIVCPNVKASAEEEAEWIPKTLQRIAALGTHTHHRIVTAARVGLRVRVQSGFTWRVADVIDTDDWRVNVQYAQLGARDVEWVPRNSNRLKPFCEPEPEEPTANAPRTEVAPADYVPPKLADASGHAAAADPLERALGDNPHVPVPLSERRGEQQQQQQHEVPARTAVKPQQEQLYEQQQQQQQAGGDSSGSTMTSSGDRYYTEQQQQQPPAAARQEYAQPEERISPVPEQQTAPLTDTTTSSTATSDTTGYGAGLASHNASELQSLSAAELADRAYAMRQGGSGSEAGTSHYYYHSNSEPATEPRTEPRTELTQGGNTSSSGSGIERGAGMESGARTGGYTQEEAARSSGYQQPQRHASEQFYDATEPQEAAQSESQPRLARTPSRVKSDDAWIRRSDEEQAEGVAQQQGGQVSLSQQVANNMSRSIDKTGGGQQQQQQQQQQRSEFVQATPAELEERRKNADAMEDSLSEYGLQPAGTTGTAAPTTRATASDNVSGDRSGAEGDSRQQQPGLFGMIKEAITGQKVGEGTDATVTAAPKA